LVLLYKWPLFYNLHVLYFYFNLFSSGCNCISMFLLPWWRVLVWWIYCVWLFCYNSLFHVLSYYCIDFKLIVYIPHIVFVSSLTVWHMLWCGKCIVYFCIIWWQIWYPVGLLNLVWIWWMCNKWLTDWLSEWLIDWNTTPIF
jgi:hypothetical protein